MNTLTVKDVMPEQFDRVGWFDGGEKGPFIELADGSMLMQGGSGLRITACAEFQAEFGREYEAALIGEAMRRFALHGVFQPGTSVWNVSKMAPADIERLGIVYVGRKVRNRDALGNGSIRFDDHPLANPYRLKPKATEQERRECLKLYRQHLRAETDQGAELRALARMLRGKRLGCWCGTWCGVGRPTLLCHAVEIALLAEEPLPA